MANETFRFLLKHITCIVIVIGIVIGSSAFTSNIYEDFSLCNSDQQDRLIQDVKDEKEQVIAMIYKEHVRAGIPHKQAAILAESEYIEALKNLELIRNK